MLTPLFDQVYVIDKYIEFKRLIDETAIIPARNEVYIEGDWLDVLPTLRKRFDLVTSHFTHGNIAFQQRKTFFSLVADSLSPHGLFFDTVFNPPPTALFTIAEVLRRFNSAPITLQTINEFNAIALFQSDRIPELGCVDTSKIYDWLLANDSGNQMLHRLIQATMSITPRGMRWDYTPARTPEVLGYHEVLSTQLEIPEPLDSAFTRAVRTLISGIRHA